MTGRLFPSADIVVVIAAERQVAEQLDLQLEPHLPVLGGHRRQKNQSERHSLSFHGFLATLKINDAKHEHKPPPRHDHVTNVQLSGRNTGRYKVPDAKKSHDFMKMKLKADGGSRSDLRRRDLACLALTSAEIGPKLVQTSRDCGSV